MGDHDAEVHLVIKYLSHQVRKSAEKNAIPHLLRSIYIATVSDHGEASDFGRVSTGVRCLGRDLPLCAAACPAGNS